MNIGQTVKTIQKEFPSVTISRLRFMEREGLINPGRSKGGTRDYVKKDIDRIMSILDLQENQFYSLKAIKNNPKLITNSSKIQIVIREYSFHDALKKSGLSNSEFNDLLNFNLEVNLDPLPMRGDSLRVMENQILTRLEQLRTAAARHDTDDVL